MKKIATLAIVLLTCFSLVRCTSDDSTGDSGMLTVNGSEFLLGTNTSTLVYNRIRSKSDTGIWLEITENPSSGNARIISVFASHEVGTHNGTYILKNDQIASGIAIPALMDAETGEQIAGGSDESQPLGTITITDQGSNRFKLSFDGVVLDPETATETTISGSCSKTFKMQP